MLVFCTIQHDHHTLFPLAPLATAIVECSMKVAHSQLAYESSHKRAPEVYCNRLEAHSASTIKHRHLSRSKARLVRKKRCKSSLSFRNQSLFVSDRNTLAIELTLDVYLYARASVLVTRSYGVSSDTSSYKINSSRWLDPVCMYLFDKATSNESLHT